MSERPLVLLDAAGVLFFEDELRVASRLADAYGLTSSEVNEWLEGDAYVPWWSGVWQWPDFWYAFSNRFGCQVRDTAYWQDAFAHVRPMHSLSLLEDWAGQADLWLLSDHRSDWLLPALGDKLKFFQATWISDQLGLTKRDQAFFEMVSSYLSPSRPRYFILMIGLLILIVPACLSPGLKLSGPTLPAAGLNGFTRVFKAAPDPKPCPSSRVFGRETSFSAYVYR